MKLIASIVISFAAGAIGNLVTIPNIPTWYAALEKPLLNPPNFVFGPVWSVLYLLMAISLYLVWTNKASGSKKRVAYAAFITQLVLNTVWSLVFFGLHSPELGILVIMLLIGAIVATIVTFRRFSKPAAYLLLPYLLWVCFAAYLTIGVAILN